MFLRLGVYTCVCILTTEKNVGCESLILKALPYFTDHYSKAYFMYTYEDCINRFPNFECILTGSKVRVKKM